jgi:hypothetical protein
MKDFLRDQKTHKDIVEFRFSKAAPAQPQWEDEEEFRFNGEMYDVIEKITVGDQLFIRCIPDRKETELLHAYQKQHDRNRSTASVLQLITATFIVSAGPSVQPSEKTIIRKFFEPSFSLSHPAAPVFIPPPRVG